ncbi:MAG: ABC transporter permease [Bdellovibrionales bacterium]
MRESFLLSWHIVRRNWLVYQKDLLANISPSLAEPAFLLLSLGVGLGVFITNVDGMSYAQYLAPGLAVSTAMFTSFFESSYGFYVRMTFENIFKAMLTTPIGVEEIAIGEFIWVSIKGAIMITLVGLFLMPFEMWRDPWLIVFLPIAGILTALPLGAMGLLASCKVHNINQFQTIYSFIIAPLYFFSGTFFPIAQMPEPLQIVAKALPVYHSVRLSQSLFWHESVVQTWLTHGPILIGYSLVLTVLALRSVRRKLLA